MPARAFGQTLNSSGMSPRPADVSRARFSTRCRLGAGITPLQLEVPKHPPYRLMHQYQTVNVGVDDIGARTVPAQRALGGVTQGLDSVFRQLLKQGLEHFMSAAQVEVLRPVVYTDDLVVACH